MSIQTKGRRWLTCHHEAGHALVRWYFGHLTDRAVVLTVQEMQAGARVEVRRGRLQACEGVVYGYDICPRPYGPIPFEGTAEDQATFDHRRAVARDIELTNCYAGFYAEAAYCRSSVGSRVLAGGSQDVNEASDILDGWGLEGEARSAVAWAAQQRASALVRSRPGSAAIGLIATRLMDRGEVDGSEIAALCRQAYGGRECDFGAWDAHWPPTLTQIRSGFIPEAIS